MKKIALAAFAAVVLSGCASTMAAHNERVAAVNASRPTCSTEAECSAMWEMAQLWVVNNAGMKLQNVTTVLLETYNPPANSTNLAVRVTKEPIGGGSYKFVVNAWCNNMFGCHPNRWEAMLDFNRTLAAVEP